MQLAVVRGMWSDLNEARFDGKLHSRTSAI